MSDVIESVGLVKTFGKVRALDGLDMTVRSGQVHGFLGPNGAGKSTTMRVLLGLLRADGGTVRLFGAVVPLSSSYVLVKEPGIVFVITNTV